MEILAAIVLVGLAAWWMNRRRERKPQRVSLTTSVVRREAVAPREQTWLSKEQSDAELIRDDDGVLGVRVGRRDGELWFVGANSGLQVPPGNLALARLGIFYFNARGWRYYDEVEINPGRQVLFQREPNNPYGGTAIALLEPRTRAIYGYVNKGFSRRISKRVDAGEKWVAFCMSRDGITVAMMTRDLAKEIGLLRK